jgi:DNA polymerase I-like protein with 3'-5' exonuclease and polymerase domains
MTDVVTIDFETYYDSEYSLSKITTEEYIRSPQFEIIGVGVKVNNHPTDWYSGENPGAFLKSLDYSKRAILCHHTAFDGAILSWHFGIKPKFWFDTLSMARPLHAVSVGGSLATLAAYYRLGEKGTEVVDAKGMHRLDFDPLRLAAYGAYCKNDCDLTYKLFRKLLPQIPVSELLVIDQTLRMYTEPVVELNVDRLTDHLRDVQLRKAELIASVSGTHGDTSAMLMSNDKFAAALQMLGVNPPRKVSLRTKKETWAFAKTDAGLTDLLEHPDDRVQALVAARLGTKSTIEETRTTNLIAVASRGRLPIMLNYYGAHTGRFSGGDKLNLQNLPKRGNIAIRQALEAPPGWMFIACDSSQIEARIVAWLAGEDELLEAFRQGRDIYSEFASEVYGRPITKADKLERFVGKTCILGLGYGMGAEKFKRTLELGQGGISVNISLDEATQIVRLYRQKYWRIVQFWQLCGNALRGMSQQGAGTIGAHLQYDAEGVILPNGLRQFYPALRSNPEGYDYISNPRDYRKLLKDRVLGTETAYERTKIYGGKLTENLTQALAALVIREQMVEAGKYMKVAFQVHDEIIAVAPTAQAQTTEATLVRVMQQPPAWALDLPVACESGVAPNYGDV